MTVTCHACKKPFTFDPAEAPSERNLRESTGQTAKSVTYYPICTHCGAQCVITRQTT